jgi:hypothetical protein
MHQRIIIIGFQYDWMNGLDTNFGKISEMVTNRLE